MSGYGEMARGVADALIGQLGGGTLVMAVAGAEGDGTAVELGYGGENPASVVLERVHGRVLQPEAHGQPGAVEGATWWEFLVPADDLEREAEELGMTVVQLVERCPRMVFAGTALTPQKVEAACAGGATYAYKVLAAEMQS